MIITETVKIVPVFKAITRYKELGYAFEKGDEIDVRVSDLPWASSARILAKCDEPDCNNIKEISYHSYNLTIRKNGFYRCFQCGQKEKEKVFLEKYGVDNPMKIKEIQQKVVETTLERHGYRYTFEKEDFQEDKKQICLKKYGVEHQLQSQEIKDKVVKTNLEKYGTEYGLQNEEIKNKIKETNLEKYGFEHATQNEEIKEKIAQTNLKRYGFRSPTQNPEIRKKQIESCKMLYGVKNPMQSLEVIQKSRQTMYENQSQQSSTQQEYLHNLFGGELNYPVSCYSADILMSDGIDIEYNGSGHNAEVKMGAISQKEFERNQIIRSKTFKEYGYKMMLITSKYDKLPSDDVLLEMLSDARSFFSANPDRSWIEFDIDLSVVRNAEHLNGLPYTFGDIRKIRKFDVSQ